MKSVNFWIFRFFLVVSIICLVGLVYLFLDSYYLRSLRTVNNASDPRWRVFDFNSRQATEGDIYNVAEVPVISKVKEVSPRRLRFWFTPPIKAKNWKVIDVETGKILTQGSKSEIQFSDSAYNGKLRFIPEGVPLLKDLCMDFSFYPKEEYRKKNLSWSDNFYTPTSEIPFSIRKPYSIDEWVGFSEDDPELIEAKKILGNRINKTVSTLEQSEQIFKFVMNKIIDADGTPSDEVQSASPLETYNLFITGKGQGWCENKALVYYLFANAAGIKTRLVDRAGKFGPLKLTGHYFCESWIPEYAKWAYVDPQIQIANLRNHDGMPLHTIDLKKLVDLNALVGSVATVYDADTGTLIRKEGGSFYNRLKNGMTGEIVLAYKFGYGNNKSFSKNRNFLNYTTLLYAPFTLPKLYMIKYIFMNGFIICSIITLFIGLIRLRQKKFKIKIGS